MSIEVSQKTWFSNFTFSMPLGLLDFKLNVLCFVSAKKIAVVKMFCINLKKM